MANYKSNRDYKSKEELLELISLKIVEEDGKFYLMDFERLGLCEELIKAISLERWEYELLSLFVRISTTHRVSRRSNSSYFRRW